MAERMVDGMVVDSAPLYCEGLVRTVQAALQATVRSYDGPREALDSLQARCCDLAILGPNIEEARRFALCRAFVRQCPEVKVILVSRNAGDPILQSDAVRAGANACVPRETGTAAFVELIRAVMANHQLFTRPALELAREPLTLTAREREVLERLASNETDAAIAGALGLSLTTVRKHSHHIITKLRAHERREAIRRARRLGWLPPLTSPDRRAE